MKDETQALFLIKIIKAEERKTKCAIITDNLKKKYIKKYAIFQYDEDVVFKTQRCCGVGIVEKILHVNNEGEFIYHVRPLKKDFTDYKNMYPITCRESDLISKLLFRRERGKDGRFKKRIAIKTN